MSRLLRGVGDAHPTLEEKAAIHFYAINKRQLKANKMKTPAFAMVHLPVSWTTLSESFPA